MTINPAHHQILQTVPHPPPFSHDSLHATIATIIKSPCPPQTHSCCLFVPRPRGLLMLLLITSISQHTTPYSQGKRKPCTLDLECLIECVTIHYLLNFAGRSFPWSSSSASGVTLFFVSTRPKLLAVFYGPNLRCMQTSTLGLCSPFSSRVGPLTSISTLRLSKPNRESTEYTELNSCTL